MSVEQFATWEGWAHVEMMGHQSVTGYVTTLYFGNVAMLHVAQPAIDRKRVLARGGYDQSQSGVATYYPAGTEVHQQRQAAETLVPVASLYRLTPLTEAAAVDKLPCTIVAATFPTTTPAALAPAVYPRCLNCDEESRQNKPVDQTTGYCADCKCEFDEDEDDDEPRF